MPARDTLSVTMVAVRVATVGAIIAAITWICYGLIPVNATTAGFAYLVAILFVAAHWGLIESIAGSVAAVFAFNFYFLPPIGKLTIADPQNWVALFAFLVTAITASQLSARAQRRAREALTRKVESERLYTLSRAMLTDESADLQFGLRTASTIFSLDEIAFYDRSRD